jgi:excisionase family DNA binding protein
LITIGELARQMMVDRATAYRWLRSGVLPIPVIHIGGTARVRQVDVDDFLAQRAREAVEDQAQLRPVVVRRKAS